MLLGPEPSLEPHYVYGARGLIVKGQARTVMRMQIKVVGVVKGTCVGEQSTVDGSVVMRNEMKHSNHACTLRV